MTEDARKDEVEKLLSDAKAVEDRREALMEDLLKQKEAAMKEFDAKLAKLGYHPRSGTLRRSHHKKAAPPAAAPASAKDKAKT